MKKGFFSFQPNNAVAQIFANAPSSEIWMTLEQMAETFCASLHEIETALAGAVIEGAVGPVSSARLGKKARRGSHVRKTGLKVEYDIFAILAVGLRLQREDGLYPGVDRSYPRVYTP